MPTQTTNYDFYLPLVNDPTDEDLWGGYLNDNTTSLDSLLFTATNDVKRNVATTYSVVEADRNRILLCDGSGGAFTVTLIAAATAGDGFRVIVKRTGATGDITIDGNSSETIDGAATYVLDEQYQAVMLACDGTNWHVEATTTNVPDASTTVKGIIEIATNAETKAGVDSTKAIVPSGLAFAFTDGSSFSGTGYQRLPSGLLMQWGTCPDSTDAPVTFPVAFTSACFNLQATSSPPSAGFARVTVPTTTGFSWQPGNGSSGGYYFAIGV